MVLEQTDILLSIHPLQDEDFFLKFILKFSWVFIPYLTGKRY